MPKLLDLPKQWAVVLVLAGIGCSASRQSPLSAGPEVGQALPAMNVAGWHNTTSEAPPELSGKVVVVDCFATWCGPCARAMPGLVEVYHRFAGHDVVFLGITPEPPDALSDIKAFSDQFEVPWPVGYGGNEVLKSLGVRAFPTLIVFGRDGIATWSSHSHGQLEGAITAALSAESATEPGVEEPADAGE